MMAIGQHSQIPPAEHARQASFVWELPPDPDWMTKAEVATLGRVSLDTVERLMQDGTLEAYRIGRSGHLRFKRTDVEASLFQKIKPTKGK
jgi:excisionase family DNA binding protein